MGVIASTPFQDYYNGNGDGGDAARVGSAKASARVAERINDGLVQKLIQALMDSYGDGGDGVVPEPMLELLQTEFSGRYSDVQYFMLISMKNMANELMKKDNDGGSDESDEEMQGIKGENLLRILMKIHLAHEQEDLTPQNIKMDGDTGTGTCSNYLFLPPIVDAESFEESDDDDNDDEDSDDSSDEDDDKPSPKKRRKMETKLQKGKTKTKLPSWQSIRSHRSALQLATLTILKIPTIPNRTLKRILQHLPIHILPHATNPLRFADFCTRAYEVGGVTSLLALHSLFLLMTQCGLEYPKFYTSLYNLIESKVFYTTYRTRFFKLLVKCLTANQMLPAYIVAAFCKRLCRCAVNAPPSGALFVLALVSNLLRKHPECSCLLHRSGGEIEDPFDAEEKDPAKSKAIESCLWELNALEKHYHPAVASMATGCGMEDEKTLYHDLDGFLVHTYKSLFDQERKRGDNKRKSKVALTFHKPQSLFGGDDIFEGIFDFPRKD